MNSYQSDICCYGFVSHVEFLCQLGKCPLNPHKTPGSCIVLKSSGIAPMFDELWSEIQDMPGEIFDMDIPELRDEKFDVNEYLNANYDY